MKRLEEYTTIVTPNGSLFLAYAPAIDGCHALGATPVEARAELENVFEMLVEEFAERREPLPPDVPQEQLIAIG